MGQGIAIVDMQSMKILYANEAVAAMSGYTVDEILDLPSFLALSPPPYAAAMDEARQRRLAGSDEPDEWDTVIHRKDGTRLEIAVTVTELEGEPTQMVALLRDVTRRKAAERGLRESEARLRTLVTRAPVLMWTVDRDGVFTMAEGQALGEIGTSSERLVGRPIKDVYARNPEVLVHYEKAFRGESSEATIETGGRTVQANLAPLYDDSGEVD